MNDEEIFKVPIALQTDNVICAFFEFFYRSLDRLSHLHGNLKFL